jgi:hypothetical protein
MRNLLCFILLLPLFVNCQTNFIPQPNIPVKENSSFLHNPWAGGINFPYFSSVDLNGDTLMDLFLVDRMNNRILTFTNNGNTNRDLAWDYAPQFMNQFPPVNKFAFLYDYNCDGKTDFFTLSNAFLCPAGIVAYKNTSATPGIFTWQKVDSCMEETFMGSPQMIYTDGVSLPHFNDIDGDGDMDILGYNSFPNGRIVYHKNYSLEHYGTCDSLDFVFESGCFGNFSLLIGGNNQVGSFHSPCRIGRFDHEEEEEKDAAYDNNIFDPTDAARRDDTISSIFALDLDNDNHMELLIGDIASNNSLMVHNGGVDMDSQDTLFPSYDVPALYNGFHYHAYFDTDNDGAKDLIVSPYYNENKKGLWVYKNLGTTSSPLFEYRADNFLQNQMIDGGEDACPVFFDYNSDGLLDIVMNRSIFNASTNSLKCGLYLYKNTGTSAAPSYELVNTNYLNLESSGYTSAIYPAFGDLDGDGDKDMVLGLYDGIMQYFQNTASASTPATFAAPVSSYMGIDVGNFATPQLFDLNRDGLLDIITGNQRGFVLYFQNSGTSSSPFFSSTPTNDSLGCIVLQPAGGIIDGYTVPFMYDSAGKTRLIVACDLGNVFTYDNIDANINGCYHQSGAIYSSSQSSRVRFDRTVSGADINNDTLVDIIIGESTGGAEIRYQSSPVTNVGNVNLIRPSFEVFPNPADKNINLRLYNFKNDVEINLYNGIGELIFHKLTVEKSVTIPAEVYSNGIYFIQLTTGNYTICRKLVVAH